MTFIPEDAIWKIQHKNRIRTSKKGFNCFRCDKDFKSGSRYFGGFHRWDEKQCIGCFLNSFENEINETKVLIAGIFAHLKVEKMKAEKNRAMDMMMELR